MLQLRQAKGALKIAQSIIEAEHGLVVFPSTQLFTLPVIRRDAVIPKYANFGGQFRIVGGHHATFRRGEVFYRVKTERCQVGDAANLPSPVLSSRRMARVLN